MPERSGALRVAVWARSRGECHPSRTGTLVQIDYRLDNMLFHPDPSAARPGASDIAYFLGAGPEADAYRRSQEALITRYHRAPCRPRRHSAQQRRDDYRRSSCKALRMAVLASLAVERLSGATPFSQRWQTDRHRW
jgi:hypothetical protein